MTNTLKVAGDLYSKPPLNALGGARLSLRKITVLTTDLITTQLIALNVLPAGHRLVDWFLEADDMDTGSALTISVGILNTYYNEQVAGTSGFRQRQGLTQAAADYSSGGATNSDSEPNLVSGQNLITASTVGQAGGRVDGPYPTTLMPSDAIGVDDNLDRIIAVQFAAAPSVAVEGHLVLGLLIDRDQE